MHLLCIVVILPFIIDNDRLWHGECCLTRRQHSPSSAPNCCMLSSPFSPAQMLLLLANTRESRRLGNTAGQCCPFSSLSSLKHSEQIKVEPRKVVIWSSVVLPIIFKDGPLFIRATFDFLLTPLPASRQHSAHPYSPNTCSCTKVCAVLGYCPLPYLMNGPSEAQPSSLNPFFGSSYCHSPLYSNRFHLYSLVDRKRVN